MEFFQEAVNCKTLVQRNVEILQEKHILKYKNQFLFYLGFITYLSYIQKSNTLSNLQIAKPYHKTACLKCQGCTEAKAVALKNPQHFLK
jgi:hypothetical protein